MEPGAQLTLFPIVSRTGINSPRSLATDFKSHRRVAVFYSSLDALRKGRIEDFRGQVIPTDVSGCHSSVNVDLIVPLTLADDAPDWLTGVGIVTLMNSGDASNAVIYTGAQALESVAQSSTTCLSSPNFCSSGGPFFVGDSTYAALSNGYYDGVATLNSSYDYQMIEAALQRERDGRVYVGIGAYIPVTRDPRGCG